MSMSTQSLSVAVIGAGIIGLSCAWELSKRGAQVTIFDRGEPGCGASVAAAGMLASGYEAASEPNVNANLFELCQQSAGLWGSFAPELEEASDCAIDYHTGGTLAVFTTGSAGAPASTLFERLRNNKIASEQLTAEQVWEIEPSLGPNLIEAISIPNDGQVDNRAVLKALLIACDKAGVRIVKNTPSSGVDLAAFDHVLWTVGADHSMEPLSILPVKGAAFSIRPEPDLPKRIIRFGSHYIVPKNDRVIIGATVEPGVRDCNLDAALISELRARASEICPAVETAPAIETWSGLRPATQDHAPILGCLPDGGFVATGHYRNGILLAPITARIMADMMFENKVDDLVAGFAPDRFSPATA